MNIGYTPYAERANPQARKNTEPTLDARRRARREIAEMNAEWAKVNRPRPGYCGCGHRLSVEDTDGVCMHCQYETWRRNR